MFKIGVVALVLACLVPSEAAPGNVAAAGSAQISGTPFPPLISFGNGTISVNFLGFKATAGLGGLITGNMQDGGPQAAVETPFGQKAGAGIGGTTDEQGNNRGYKYAYAENSFTKLSKLISGSG